MLAPLVVQYRFSYLFAVIVLPCAALAACAQPSWKELVKDGTAPFGQRDSGKGIVFNGKLWLNSGFYDSSPKLYYDLWCSPNGVVWDRAIGDPKPADPAKPPANRIPFDNGSPLVVRNGGQELWAIGSSVWKSRDGKKWDPIALTGDRLPPGGENAHAVVIKNDIYYVHTDYGKAGVFVSKDGKAWKCLTEAGVFGMRNGSAVIAFRDQLWLMGGDRLYPDRKNPYVGLNDIGRSRDGAKWECLKAYAAWGGRMWPGVAVQDDRRIWLVGSYDTRAKSNTREIWYSDDGLEWKLFAATNNIGSSD